MFIILNENNERRWNLSVKEIKIYKLSYISHLTAVKFVPDSRKSHLKYKVFTLFDELFIILSKMPLSWPEIHCKKVIFRRWFEIIIIIP